MILVGFLLRFLLRFPATEFEPAVIREPTSCKSLSNGTAKATTNKDADMKEFEFAFDDEIFEESNCRTVRVQEPYKPKQCDPEVCLKAVVFSYFLSLKFRKLRTWAIHVSVACQCTLTD